MRQPWPRALSQLLYLLLIATASIATADPIPLTPPAYVIGDAVSITCVNRTADTGEHIQSTKTGQIQYAPFLSSYSVPTSFDLSFSYGVDEFGRNFTLPSITDATYHILEFYVHHDSPLSCRVPARPLDRGDHDLSDMDADAEGVWVPLIFALTGKLESSHLHIASTLNVVFHTNEHTGTIIAAAAYSVDHESPMRIIIGDPLPMRFSVRWYTGLELPASDITASNETTPLWVWLALLAAVGAAACFAYLKTSRPRNGRARCEPIVATTSKRLKGYGFPPTAAGGATGGATKGGCGGGGIANTGGYGYGIGGKRLD